MKVIELLGNGDTQYREIEIATFAELVDFFDEIYADFLSQLGEEPYGPPPLDKSSGEIIGGFGVRCTNVFGSEIEVGIGRDWWLLIDLTPDGRAFVVDDRHPKHDFIFYLAGWQYTGIGAKDVIARDKCLAATSARIRCAVHNKFANGSNLMVAVTRGLGDGSRSRC